jgi:hypothetical protein
LESPYRGPLPEKFTDYLKDIFFSPPFNLYGCQGGVGDFGREDPLLAKAIINRGDFILFYLILPNKIYISNLTNVGCFITGTLATWVGPHEAEAEQRGNKG